MRPRRPTVRLRRHSTRAAESRMATIESLTPTPRPTRSRRRGPGAMPYLLIGPAVVVLAWSRPGRSSRSRAVGAEAGSRQVRALPQRRHDVIRGSPQLREHRCPARRSGRLPFARWCSPPSTWCSASSSGCRSPSCSTASHLGADHAHGRAAVRVGRSLDGVDAGLLLDVQQPVRRRQLPARPDARRAHARPRLVRRPAPGSGRHHHGRRVGRDPAAGDLVARRHQPDPEGVLEAARATAPAGGRRSARSRCRSCGRCW